MSRSGEVIEVGGMRAVCSIAKRERSGDWFAVGTLRVSGWAHGDRRFWALAATGGTRELALEAFRQEMLRYASAPIPA